MNLLLIPLIGLWRMWLGRGTDGWPAFLKRADGRPFPGATYVQYALLIGIVFALIGPWNIALTDAIALLLLARLCGHTPMLYSPGVPVPPDRLDGIERLMYEAAAYVPGTELKWWTFAVIRYSVVATIWREALLLQGSANGHYIVMASLLMIAIYRLRAAINVDVKYAELVGWMAYGAALAI